MGSRDRLKIKECVLGLEMCLSWSWSYTVISSLLMVWFFAFGLGRGPDHEWRSMRCWLLSEETTQLGDAVNHDCLYCRDWLRTSMQFLGVVSAVGKQCRGRNWWTFTSAGKVPISIYAHNMVGPELGIGSVRNLEQVSISIVPATWPSLNFMSVFY